MIQKIRSTVFILSLVMSVLIISCGTPKINDGNQAYDLKKYHLATKLLMEDYNKAVEGPEKGAVAWKIAESYKNINETGKAEKWYYNALIQGVEADAQFEYAKMLMTNKKYDEAIVEFRQILRIEPYRRLEIKTLINSSELAMDWMDGAIYTTVTNLEEINSSKADFSPGLYHDREIVFVSSRGDEEEDNDDLWTGNDYYNLYKTKMRQDGSFSTPEIFNEVLRTEYNDGPFTFSSGYTEIFFTQCGSTNKAVNDYCSIYYSILQPEGGWSTPELVLLFDDSLNVGQPTISKDGEIIVFAAVDPQGFGGSDLYYCSRTFDGWSLPFNLGLKINSSGNEAFPYFDDEGNLYFSSDGHGGMGGLDIFKSKKTGKKKWQRPNNIGYPLNSNADDFGIIIQPLTVEEQNFLILKGYLTSSREGGKGLDDIYRFEKAKPPTRYELEGIVLENILQDPTDPKSKVINTKPLADAEVVFQKLRSSGVLTLDTLGTDKDGAFYTLLSPDTDYKLLATKIPEYFSKSDNVTTKGTEGKPGDVIVIKSTIILDRIIEEVEIVIPNIYYDFNEWDIRPDAAQVLDTTILIMLIENPKLTVELGSHTDARGGYDLNLELSEKRANSVVDYLVGKGIEKERLKPKGYGELQPFVEGDGTKLNETYINSLPTEEDQEEAHQKNRRTTFRIISDKKIIDSVQPDNIIVDPKND